MAETPFTIPLHIIPKDEKTHELRYLAAELDRLETGDCRESYTVPQAFAQLIIFAPHRLAEFASGWYFDNHPLLD